MSIDVPDWSHVSTPVEGVARYLLGLKLLGTSPTALNRRDLDLSTVAKRTGVQWRSRTGQYAV